MYCNFLELSGNITNSQTWGTKHSVTYTSFSTFLTQSILIKKLEKDLVIIGTKVKVAGI